jgi:F-type H+-transporting ATPase subunit b
VSIDWFTFVSQIINFLVLVWLLKWLLYRPITNIMAERKDNIQQRIRDADERKEEAEQMKETYEQHLDDLDREREQKLEETRAEAEREKERLMHEAREEVERARTNWMNQLEDDRERFLKQFRNRSGTLVCRTARRVLEDLADEDLNQRIVQQFIEQLRTSDTLPDELPADETGAETDLVVHTAFELSTDLQDRIRNAVEQRWSPDATLRFKTNADLICGIELDLGDRSVNWNIRDELERMEEQVREYLEGRSLEEDLTHSVSEN